MDLERLIMADDMVAVATATYIELGACLTADAVIGQRWSHLGCALPGHPIQRCQH